MCTYLQDDKYLKTVYCIKYIYMIGKTYKRGHLRIARIYIIYIQIWI